MFAKMSINYTKNIVFVLMLAGGSSTLACTEDAADLSSAPLTFEGDYSGISYEVCMARRTTEDNRTIVDVRLRFEARAEYLVRQVAPAVIIGDDQSIERVGSLIRPNPRQVVNEPPGELVFEFEEPPALPSGTLWFSGLSGVKFDPAPEDVMQPIAFDFDASRVSTGSCD